ncbi:MAG: PINc/VapC family ATPase [Candidatus Nanoarchaeia archaeon]|nr:PINc/VapC family ATPase [Candidatus Nanoarchaeia archaeon]
MKTEIFVPDTSVIIEGILSSMIEKGQVSGTIIIHNAVLAELEHQANSNREIGLIGINEIKKIISLKKIKIEYDGQRPTIQAIKYSNKGEIDSLIRDLAKTRGAILLTADKVQYEIALASQIDAKLIEIKKIADAINIEKFFDETTMSVHLREESTPKAKKGKPGEWKFVELNSKKLTSKEVEGYAEDIIIKTNIDSKSFVEIERHGSIIVQFRNYRIVITKPPLSDGWEITAVRPVKILSLNDYNLNEKLYLRLKDRAEGILVAGAPGNGKSTFCQALAVFYLEQKKIVKTVEAPRDLILPDEITQYSKNRASNAEIHDILLLSRPDYTIFDEIRNVEDFELFKDMRLSGVGMIGVVHATNPIDAIQRFIGKVELGMVPSILDTVLYIEKGNVGKCLEVSMTVRVPTGMTEEDLARPIVEVKDFLTGELVYEMYTFGEQTVVIPIKAIAVKSGSVARTLAADVLKEKIRKELPYGASIDLKMTGDNRVEIFVPKSKVGELIGKRGANIKNLEEKIGVKIDVRESSGSEETGNEKESSKKSIAYEIEISKKGVQIFVGEPHAGDDLDVEIDGEYLLTATASKKGVIKISSNSDAGKKLLFAKKGSQEIRVLK